MTLVPNPAPERFGGVLLDEDGWVTGFCRRGDPRQLVSLHVRAGRRAIACSRRSPTASRPRASLGIYPALIARNPRAIRGFVCDVPFVEIGTPADYLLANDAIAAAEGVDPFAPGAERSIAVIGTRDAVDCCGTTWSSARMRWWTSASWPMVYACRAGARWTRCAVVRAHGRRPQGSERLDGDLILAPIS